MKPAIALGLAIIAVLLIVRVSLPLPWSDPTSAETIRRAELTGADPYGEPTRATDIVFGFAPPALMLLVLAAAFLVILAWVLPTDEATLLLILSPAFITTFTTAGPAAVTAPLTALLALLLQRGKNWGLIGLPLIFVIDTGAGLAAALILIIIAIVNKQTFVALTISFAALVLALGASILVANAGVGLVALPAHGIDVLLDPAGTSIAVLCVLAAIGIALRYREQHDPMLFAILLAVPALAMLEHASLVLTALLAAFGARAWNSLWTRQWSFHELRTITLTLVLCALVFGTIVTMRTSLQVDEDTVELVRFLSDATPEGTAVLAPTVVAGPLRLAGVYTESSTATTPNDLVAAARTAGTRYVVTRGSTSASGTTLVYSDDRETTYFVYALSER